MAEPSRGRKALSALTLLPRWFWARLGSVRAKATVVSVLVVGAAMAFGALGLLHLLQGNMRESVEEGSEAQARDVSSFLRVGNLPVQLPAGRGGTLTQVVGPDGQILAASEADLTKRRITTKLPGEEGVLLADIPGLSERYSEGKDVDGPYLVLSHETPSAELRGTPVTVYVAGSLRPLTEATKTVETALAIGLPALVVLVGMLVWTFAGRALRPVEAIRSEVSDITGHDLHRRVPQPRSHDEVAALATTMNEMLDRLESAAADQRRFVADASHELRSPLTMLQATFELAVTHPEEASWDTVAPDVLDETRRLQDMVDDLLALARAEQGVPRALEEDVDLDELVFHEVALRRVTADVRFDLSKVSGARVTGDRGQLARIVHNLLDNACRHANEEVKVEVGEQGSVVRLTVTDDGPGIPEAERARVFERFARLDEARDREAGGSGLGLAIVREIVRVHGGTVRVEDSKVGARMVVELPAMDADRPLVGEN